MFADPVRNLDHLRLRPGIQVADLGAGTGFYTLAAAKIIGSGGKVFAIEVQKDLIDKLKTEAEHRQLHNVEVVWGNVEKKGGTRLRDGSVDKAICSNLLFQVDDKEEAAAEISRLLKQGGEVMVIDWDENAGIAGPGRGRAVPKDKVLSLFTGAGFSLSEEFDAGEHHYGFIFKKSV